VIKEKVLPKLKRLNINYLLILVFVVLSFICCNNTTNIWFVKFNQLHEINEGHIVFLRNSSCHDCGYKILNYNFITNQNIYIVYDSTEYFFDDYTKGKSILIKQSNDSISRSFISLEDGHPLVGIKNGKPTLIRMINSANVDSLNFYLKSNF